jgi:uncharacterized YigZ family protein
VSGYLVPAGVGTAVLEERRSRFLATVTRVENEVQARAVIAAARAEHRQARHHCSAFVLGPRGDLARSSDDGEPAGTAGAPILEALRGAGDGRGVSDVVAVVTRWFGGVLLGAGGLVRAYGDVVRAALDDAGLVQRVQVALTTVTVGHEAAARLENDLRARGFVLRDTAYAEEVTLTVAAPPEVPVDRIVAEATSGTARVSSAGLAWVDGPPGR